MDKNEIGYECICKRRCKTEISQDNPSILEVIHRLVKFYQHHNIKAVNKCIYQTRLVKAIVKAKQLKVSYMRGDMYAFDDNKVGSDEPDGDQMELLRDLANVPYEPEYEWWKDLGEVLKEVPIYSSILETIITKGYGNGHPLQESIENGFNSVKNYFLLEFSWCSPPPEIRIDILLLNWVDINKSYGQIKKIIKSNTINIALVLHIYSNELEDKKRDLINMIKKYVSKYSPNFSIYIYFELFSDDVNFHTLIDSLINKNNDLFENKKGWFYINQRVYDHQ